MPGRERAVAVDRPGAEAARVADIGGGQMIEQVEQHRGERGTPGRREGRDAFPGGALADREVPSRGRAAGHDARDRQPRRGEPSGGVLVLGE